MRSSLALTMLESRTLPPQMMPQQCLGSLTGALDGQRSARCSTGGSCTTVSGCVQLLAHCKGPEGTRKDVKEVLSYPNKDYGDTSSLTFFADLLFLRKFTPGTRHFWWVSFAWHRQSHLLSCPAAIHPCPHVALQAQSSTQ